MVKKSIIFGFMILSAIESFASEAPSYKPEDFVTPTRSLPSAFPVILGAPLIPHPKNRAPKTPPLTDEELRQYCASLEKVKKEMDATLAAIRAKKEAELKAAQAAGGTSGAQ